MAASKPRFTTRFRFTASARLDAPAAKQMEAVASLDRLRTLLPRDIDPESHPTLLFVAGNLAVGGVANLNDDALTLEDTIRTHRSFEWQLVDVEHLRSDIKGFIVKAGLSELGTDRILTPEEARAAGKPVNVAIVVALWKVADADLCDFIQRMDAPASPDKGKLSFSFEVGFDDYDIVVLPAGASNLALASQIVTPDSPEFARMDRLLRVNGGKGVFGKDSHVARILAGNIVPLGAGIVTVPAAAVKGLTTITSNPHAETDAAQEVDAGLYKYSSTQLTLSAADAAPFLEYANSIPDEQVHTDPDDPTMGRERESHATVLYGIKDADHSAVQSCLADFGPITITMGKVSMFEGTDGRPDVLKVDVHGDDIHRAHHLIKTATATETKWPDYCPHLTISYMKPGMARGYVGDTRFEGKTFTFPSITFSPHTGDRVEIALAAKPSPYTDQIGQVPVRPSATPETSMAQSDEDGVYSDETMSTPSRQIKLSQGWQERLASLMAANAGKEGNAPLVNGVNVTLSDGRTLSNVKVFDGQTLELDKELSMSGVVITDMTPGVAPQADDPAIEHPHKALVYHTTSPEQQARDAANEAKRKEGQNAAYTDASVSTTLTNGISATALARLESLFASPMGRVLVSDSINTSLTSVSPSNPTTSPMNLSELKQSLASVKTVDEAVANVTLFADAIAKASEQLVVERTAAQDAAKAAQASVDQIKADLAALTKTHNEIVAAQTAKAAEAAFNDRMNSVEATFDLDDEVRAEIVPEITSCADDAAFAKWMTSAKKKMKGFIKKKADDKAKADDDGDTDAAKATLAAKTALASAAANLVDAPLRQDFEATATLAEQMQSTFAANITIGGVKVKDIAQKKK